MKSEDVRKWYILATCCGLSASSIGICVNSNGVFFQKVSSEIEVGIGLFAAQATISNNLIGLFSTIAIKTIGRFNTKRIVSSGIIMAGISTALMSRGNSSSEEPDSTEIFTAQDSGATVILRLHPSSPLSANLIKKQN